MTLGKETILKRLALIKYLFKMGVNQSYQFEPPAAFSILCFHDATEMFLKLAAEHRGIKSKDFNFMEYWDKIPELTLKESMRNLNERRVNIKHKGILPSKSDIEISRVNTSDFFDQNTLNMFDVDFKDVSLLNLIKYEKTKVLLEKAQEALDSNNEADCLGNAAESFMALISEYEGNKGYHRSPFYFGRDFTFITSSSMKIEERNMKDFVDKVQESIKSIQKVIKILSLGIDYKQYVKFNLIIPSAIRVASGEYHFFENAHNKKKLTRRNCQFCIDFVLDSALKLQEFDFDLSEIMEIPKPSVIERSVKIEGQAKSKK